MSHRWSRNDGEQGVRFSRTVFIVLVLIGIGLVMFDRPGARTPGLASFRAGFTDLAAPLLELAAQPIRAVKNIGPYFRRQGELAEENARLTDELSAARYWEDLAYRQRDRLEIYERALNVQTPATQDRIGAWTVADPEGPFVQARLIGSGRDAGIDDGYPVINLYGLVGRVYETGRRSARVLLLTDLNSRVPVMADRSNARAILIGDNTTFPRLEYVGRTPDLEEGDRIVSSGDDGVLPRGLPVGEAIRARDGSWRVRLYSDQAPLDFVWVWPYAAASAPEPEPDMSLESVSLDTQIGEESAPPADDTAGSGIETVDAGSDDASTEATPPDTPEPEDAP